MRKKKDDVDEEEDDEAKDKFKTFMGVRVMWPPDCADDILVDCIAKT